MDSESGELLDLLVDGAVYRAVYRSATFLCRIFQKLRSYLDSARNTAGDDRRAPMAYTATATAS